MKVKINIPIIFIIILSFNFCKNPNKQDAIDIQKHLDSILFRANAKYCDTCVTILIVEHNECTECSDLYVDSGIVFINRNAIKQFDSTWLARKNDFEDIRYEHYEKLNTADLCLDDKNDYYKLWPDTISFKDWNKKYRVKGKITKFNGSYLKFKLLDYTLLDTNYSKKIDLYK